MKHKTEWREEFDKFFNINEDSCPDCYKCSERIKNFIQSLLDKNTKEIIDKVESINVSGGGSGRRLKLELLNWLNNLK